jgi:hypothetical protein
VKEGSNQVRPKSKSDPLCGFLFVARTPGLSSCPQADCLSVWTPPDSAKPRSPDVSTQQSLSVAARCSQRLVSARLFAK